MKDQLSKLKSQNEKLKSSNSKLIEQIEETNRTHAEFEQMNKGLNIEIDQLKQINNKLKHEIEVLKDDTSSNNSADDKLEQKSLPFIDENKSSTRTSSYKLDPNLGKFSGKGDVEAFLFVADSALKAANVPLDQQLVKMIPHFVNGPLSYLRSFVDAGNNSWPDFKKILRERYTPFDQERKLRNELLTIKHYGNFENFSRKFLLLVNQQKTKVDELDKI